MNDVILPPALRRARLRRWEASDYLMLQYNIQLAPSTLAKLASLGGGPRFQKSGRTPLYPVAELDLFAIERLGPVRLKSSAV